MESCSSASKCGSGMRVSLLDYVRESQVLELLSHVSNGRNNSQRCWIVHVACHCTSCCVLLHVVACCQELLHQLAHHCQHGRSNSTPNIVDPTMLGVVAASFCTQLYRSTQAKLPSKTGIVFGRAFFVVVVLFCFPFCLFVFYFIFVFVFFSSFQLLLYCKNFTFVI